jgi:hypothetical protein
LGRWDFLVEILWVVEVAVEVVRLERSHGKRFGLLALLDLVGRHRLFELELGLEVEEERGLRLVKVVREEVAAPLQVVEVAEVEALRMVALDLMISGEVEERWVLLALWLL